jgi:hypothetical protein
MKHSNHLLHVGCRTAPSRRVSAGCAPSGLALHPHEHQGCRRCAQVFGDEDPGVQEGLPDERGQARLDLLVDVGCAHRNWCWSARCPSNARPDSCCLLDRRRLRERIHGRPRSDRKKRFLLSAVAPSTITRHPREAKPINWAQRGGLALGGKLSPDAEATFHRAIMHAW